MQFGVYDGDGHSGRYIQYWTTATYDRLHVTDQTLETVAVKRVSESQPSSRSASVTGAADDATAPAGPSQTRQAPSFGAWVEFWVMRW